VTREGKGFTPTNASWANPIEAQFGPVRTFVMGASDHPSHTVLAASSRTTCAGATPTPAIPTSWPPNAANAPASAANGTSAGAAPSPKPHEPVNVRGQRTSAALSPPPIVVLGPSPSIGPPPSFGEHAFTKSPQQDAVPMCRNDQPPRPR